MNSRFCSSVPHCKMVGPTRVSPKKSARMGAIGPGELLVEHDLLDQRQALAPVLLGPRGADPSALAAASGPIGVERLALGAASGGTRARTTRREGCPRASPGPRCAKRLGLGRVGQVHRRSTVAAAPGRRAKAPVPEACSPRLHGLHEQERHGHEEVAVHQVHRHRAPPRPRGPLDERQRRHAPRHRVACVARRGRGRGRRPSARRYNAPATTSTTPARRPGPPGGRARRCGGRPSSSSG